MAFKRVVVFGAGAMGSYLGACLSSVSPVTLVARREHVEAMKGRGLFVGGQADIFLPPEKLHAVTGISTLSEGCLVVVTVKLSATREAGQTLGGLARADTVFLLAQNGLAGRDLFLEGAGGRVSVARAVASCGVDFRDAGRVEFWGGGGLVFEPGQHTEEFMELFSGAGVECAESEDFEKDLWLKLAANCVVNPLSALLDRRNREVITDDLANLRRRIVVEVSALAAAEGHPLPDDAAEHIDAALKKSRNRSSMLQDIQMGRATEVRYLNGFVARRSAELGLEAPTNAALAALVRARASEAASS